MTKFVRRCSILPKDGGALLPLPSSAVQKDHPRDNNGPTQHPSKQEGAMTSAAELRAEAGRLRNLLARVEADPAEVAAMQAMIDELESRAKEMDNGSAS